MKILEVIPTLDSGGAEVFLVNLSNELAKMQNTEITILTLFPICEKQFLVKRISPNIKLISFRKKKGIDIKILIKIYKYIKDQKFNIAHFHVNAITYSIFTVALYRKCKYFATIHNDAYKESSGIHRFLRKLMFENKLMKPISISNESDRSFRELYKSDVTLIYNGVSKYKQKEIIDLDIYRITPFTKIFLNVASVQPSKNQLAIARVFNQLVREGDDVVLLIIGRISDLYKECAEELKKETSSNVHLLGEVSNPRDYMVKADYFILPSHYEGLPITLLESLSVGCVPIVTAVGGNIDVIKDGYNGYLIPDSSEESIYGTVKQILKADKEEYTKIRAEVKKCSEKYTIEHCANMYMKAFES